MPIYDYRCDHCGHAFSAVQSYTDATLTACPNCGKRPRKVMAAPALVFKGSGWYKTDSRAGSKAAKADAKADGAEAKTAAGVEKTGEAKTGETKTGETKTGEAKTGEAKTGDTKTDSGSKPAETKASPPKEAAS